VYRKIVKLLASLKLAVLTLAIIAVIISVGTVVESRFDAWTAKNLVYNSIWMWMAMGLLVVNLIAVILDRWPWKPRHAAFIFAHIGIIIIIYGALLTQLFGIDGTVRLTRSTTPTKEVTVQETEINVYRSRTGENYEKVHGEEVNFLKNPLREDKPILIKAKGLEFGIYESIPYGLSQMKVEESDQAQSGGAVRYQLSNMNVSEIDWLVQRNPFERAEKQVGPVFITFGGLWERTPEINEIRLFQDEKGHLNYALYRKDTNTPNKTGQLAEGQNLKTDWMGLEVKILRYLPKAVQKYQVTAMDRPTPMTSPSLRVKANGSESYLVLNDYVKVFTDEYVYLVAYQNKRLPLGFDLSLLNFQKTDYPGTMRAMAYESEVQYDEQKALISMNEPLKYKGFYIYQASFEQSPTGAATASILSVNRDPGRIWKYLGSLVMCLGIVMLFYFKKRAGKK
jgi:hypothetical protein